MYSGAANIQASSVWFRM